MEGLVAVLIEALAALIAPLAAAAASALVALASLALETIWLVIELMLSRRAKQRVAAASPEPTAPPIRRRRWRRAALIALGSLSLLACATVAVAELWFSDDVIAYGLQRWQQRSGIQLDYRITHSSLLSGRATLEDVHARSPADAARTFDLIAQRIEVDVSTLGLLTGQVHVESARVATVRGRFAADLDAPPASARGRDFVIDRLVIEDIAIDVVVRRHGREIAGPLIVAHWETAPLHRSTALFDSLFRTQASGTVCGAPFTIASAPTEHGGTTRWNAQGLPAELMADYVGGPFAWIDAGRIDIDVDDAWSLEPPKSIRMHWRMVGHGLSLVPADELGGTSRRLVAALTTLLEQRHGELDLSFDVTVDPDRFTIARSLDAAGLCDLLAPAVTESIARELGWEPERVREAGHTLQRFGKEVLEHWRKKREAARQK